MNEEGAARRDLRVGAVILAAGRGSRLGPPSGDGAPKALCRLEGKTFLARALEATRLPGIVDRVVVIGHHAERIRAAAGGVRVVRNPAIAEGTADDPGQTSSVKVGLRALGAGLDACLVLPVDFPLVTAADVADLLAAVRSSRPLLAVPSWSGRRGHPLLLAAALLPEVLALADDAPLRDVVRAHAGEILHVSARHAGVLEDVDTAEDLARLGALPPGDPTITGS